MYTNRAHCRALRLMFALRKEQAYFINLNGICLRLRPKGVQGASGKPPASGMIRQLCRNQFPVGGMDAPTLARVVGLPPRGGKYFLSKRKKVPKKASGTATTGKSPLLPILTAGLAMSRAMELDSFHQLLERARARLFPPSKWAGLFPFAAYRRSVPPQLAWGRLKRRCLGCFGVVRVVLRHRKTDLNR